MGSYFPPQLSNVFLTEPFSRKVVGKEVNKSKEPICTIMWTQMTPFQKLFQQYYQYGYWKVFVNRKHKTITTTRQLIPALFVLFLTLGLALPLTNGYLKITYCTILVSYLLLAIKHALSKSLKAGMVVNIVFTFLILHWSYGTGYLKGIVDFLILNRKKISTQNMKLSR